MSPRQSKTESVSRQSRSTNVYSPAVDDKSKPLRRLWQMLMMLEEAPDGLTISEMSVRLQTSTRTIRRYLECVEDVLGGDFKTSKKTGEERRFMLCRQPIGGTHRGPTPEKKAAIFVAEEIISTMFAGTALADAMKSGTKALCSSVSEEYRLFAFRVASRIAVPLSVDPTSHQKDAFDVLLKGILSNTAVKITLDTNRQGERAEMIFPYTLERDTNGEILLLYFSSKEDSPAVVPLRRIRMVKLGKTQFVFPENFDRQAHLSRAVTPPIKEK